MQQDPEFHRTIYSEQPSELTARLCQCYRLVAKPLSEAPDDWHLVARSNVLQLRHPELGQVRLSSAELHRRAAARSRLPLARACGLRRGLRIHDAFAGWGSDGLTLWLMGAVVSMTERNVAVHAVLSERCLRMGSPIVPVCMDAADWIQHSGEEIDVLYLDPIFPPRRKTAKPSVRMQALEAIAESADPRRTFESAAGLVRERIVVKRRAHDPVLVPRIDWQIPGRSVRFDVYRAGSCR
ncbi:MAG: class I SAM-dependent methyltransferase [Pseudomonadales bacterium]|nr:class I SAM-dependent methyltransferase [Pseudomonadales bacterium]